MIEWAVFGIFIFLPDSALDADRALLVISRVLP